MSNTGRIILEASWFNLRRWLFWDVHRLWKSLYGSPSVLISNLEKTRWEFLCASLLGTILWVLRLAFVILSLPGTGWQLFSMLKDNSKTKTYVTLGWKMKCYSLKESRCLIWLRNLKNKSVFLMNWKIWKWSLTNPFYTCSYWWSSLSFYFSPLLKKGRM